MANLARHVRNVRKFGVPSVVGINRFSSDTEAELDLVRGLCREQLGVEAVVCEHWARGSAGIEELAGRVVGLCDEGHPLDGRGFTFLYPDEMPLWEKVRTIAREIYGAEDIIADTRVREQIRDFQAQGYGHFPICVAKTQYSFSTDPALRGAPSGHVVPIREVRLAGGRRVPGRDLRRDHDHARPATGAGGRADPARRGREGRGPVLGDAASRPARRRERRRGSGMLLLVDFAAILVRH